MLGQLPPALEEGGYPILKKAHHAVVCEQSCSDLLVNTVTVTSSLVAVSFLELPEQQG